MTIECYYAHCPYHSINHGPDEGPFCHLPTCVIPGGVYKVVYETDRVEYFCDLADIRLDEHDGAVSIRLVQLSDVPADADIV